VIRRLYVEKRPGLRCEEEGLLRDLRAVPGVRGLTGLRLLKRYDVEGLGEADFARAVHTVFSEPPVDEVCYELPVDPGQTVLAVEYLPGQFDQRADSAAQCLQMQTQGERPRVASAVVYLLEGCLDARALAAIKRYLINPVEAREAGLALPDSLQTPVSIPEPPPVLSGFRQMDAARVPGFLAEHELAMDADDLAVCQKYFVREGRDPSLSELKVLDTYWSDHCRHTTFLTHINKVDCADPVIRATLEDYLVTRKALDTQKPFTLMDVATIAARALKRQGKLTELDESEEVNACTLRLAVDTPAGPEDWLVLFKNETHNHPTEIEPFGGAATCIGGAIRDPLSARAYVYAGMRVTGAADPNRPLEDTLPGKLPQRQITQKAAAGFSSYGNQIGVATGCVREIYHPGFVAKRMECGAVMGAVRAADVRRERPLPGDRVLLVGGRTGRDGIGGASGSSLAHTTESVSTAAAQVQKGNAPEERKLQRLFLNPEATRLIKRCNDFGAGGVSVAIGELADGLDIDLDAVPVKYAGLTGTELAISESQERMAVVVAPGDVGRFIRLCDAENLECTAVAEVTALPRLVMRHRGRVIVDLARDFLNENGARKNTDIVIKPASYHPRQQAEGFGQAIRERMQDLNGAFQQGLVERFDSTIGAGTLLFPLGGKYRATAPCAMAHSLPVPGGTRTASFMSFGYDPYISSQSPYHGAYLAVVEAVCRLLAAGAPWGAIYLSHQEYFPRLGADPARWGMPLASLLGAFRAQMELGCAAIGGKDSMSGSFEHLDVPPTLISFAVTVGDRERVVSPELKGDGHPLVWLRPQRGADGLPLASSLEEIFHQLAGLMDEGLVLACMVPGRLGAGHALAQMALGNRIGVQVDSGIPLSDLFDEAHGSFLVELSRQADAGLPLGRTIAAPELAFGTERLALDELAALSGRVLADIFPVCAGEGAEAAPPIASSGRRAVSGPSIARPRVLIPVFPGTNCEEDCAAALRRAGALPEIFLVRNLTSQAVRESIRAFARALGQAQVLLIPGGFSGGDEPDGSGKFITALLRARPVHEALLELLNTRKGLVGGICNGFQALVKTGLLPDGVPGVLGPGSPTLSMNRIARHQSQLVNVRITSTLSPWFSRYEVGQVRSLPVSSGEGRFLCSEQQAAALAAAGQIAAQYCDSQGRPSMDIRDNPSGSVFAVEALTSPDGRVMGRMGHAERMLDGLYRNVPTTGEDPLFLGMVDYFR